MIGYFREPIKLVQIRVRNSANSGVCKFLASSDRCTKSEMSNNEGPPMDSTVRNRKKGCCGNYCDELSRKALQKKPISIDLGQLLRTQLNRCLRTVDLVGYGIGN